MTVLYRHVISCTRLWPRKRGTDIPEIGMAPSRIIETVDVLKGGGCWLTLPPKHFGLQALEKGLDHSVV